MIKPDWSAVFGDEKVLKAEHVQGGYANDVWHIKTNEDNYIAKIPRTTPDHEKPFWYGLYNTFGLDLYHHLRYRQKLSDLIDRHSLLKTPSILRVDFSEEIIPRPYIITRFLKGQPASLSDGNDTGRVAYELGEHFGGLHQVPFDYWGSFPGDPKHSLQEWKERVPGAMRKMAQKWFPDDPRVHRELEEVLAGFGDLPDPTEFALILPDLRPSQFMERDGNLFALVDVESHVVGPRVLDWIALEYSLKPEDAPRFVEGYEKHLPAPKLGPVRRAYRLLYFLIDILGETDLEAWMNAPTRFE